VLSSTVKGTVTTRQEKFVALHCKLNHNANQIHASYIVFCCCLEHIAFSRDHKPYGLRFAMIKDSAFKNRFVNSEMNLCRRLVTLYGRMFSLDIVFVPKCSRCFIRYSVAPIREEVGFPAPVGVRPSTVEWWWFDQSSKFHPKRNPNK